MDIRNLVRFGGGAFLIGALFQIFGSIFHGNNGEPGIALTAMWVPVQLALLLFYALMCVGLVALDRAQSERAGKLGKVGFFLALIGSALTILTSMGYAFTLPAYAVQLGAPKTLFELIDPAGPNAWLFYLTMGYVVLFVPGFILTGIAIMRAGQFPRWAGLLVAVGALLTLSGGVPNFAIGRTLGGVVFALGLLWLGYAMWAEKRAVLASPPMQAI